MKSLRRIAILSTAISGLALFFLGNTALAKPTGGRPCVLVFELPFTEKLFELPLWMWGLVPSSVLALSSLAAIGSWIALLVGWISRQVSTKRATLMDASKQVDRTQ
jgi:hypothetical protein